MSDSRNVACEQALLLGERGESREIARASGEAARGRGTLPRVLARLASLAQIGELARGLVGMARKYKSPRFLNFADRLSRSLEQATKNVISDE